MKPKIFITGGHLTPALAVIANLQKRGPGWEIFYVGRQHSAEGDKNTSVEFSILQDSDSVHFLTITTGRLQRTFTRHTIPSLLKIPVGFIQSFYWLLKFRPQVILSFGGYVAVPMAIAGYLLGIPILTHEQTVSPGLANKIVAAVASRILLTWESSMDSFPSYKTTLTGNPIRQETFEVHKTAMLEKYEQIKKNARSLKTLYITGGNQGSASINKVVAEALPQLLSKHIVIHSRGQTSDQTLSSQNYMPFDYIGPQDIGWVLANADIIIGRSGANTVIDIAALGKVAILIPLPWSGGAEQMKNAQTLAPFGSEILPQTDLSAKKLVATVEFVEKDLAARKIKAQQAKKLVSRDAVEKIVDEVEKVSLAKN